MRTDEAYEHHVRVLIEQLVKEGRSEREIVSEVRRAQAESGFVARTRTLDFFR
jgi:hypothetical protein